jgi:hypothetical protein
MDPAKKFTKFDGTATKAEAHLYASNVGAINWAATVTRPDFAYAASKFAQYTSNPGPQHWDALEWLWGYICKTIDYELVYKGDCNKNFSAYSGASPKGGITGFSDADWAGCLDTRKSTGGFLIFFGLCLVSWKSKLQTNVTRSSTEAEYVQLSITACEMITYRRLVEGLTPSAVRVNGSTLPASTLFGDNQGSIIMAIYASSGNRTRHIEVHHHYVRQEVKKGSIVLQYVNTKAQLADMLTKPLAKVEHTGFMRLLGLRSRRERLETSS